MASHAWLSKVLKDEKILCQACSHSCKLSEGQYGICGVRRVEDGKLKLLVYGLVAAVNIDPVEKKPLYHFLPESMTFSIGTVGCNLSCAFCQNYEISQYPKDHNLEIKGRRLPPKQIVELAIKHKCKSISFTYNEPIVFFEYTYDTARLAHQNGLKNIYVTSGFETHKALDLLAPYIDGMNIDLKSFSDKFYKDVCGGRLKPVLECIKYAHQKGIWIEITTLLITDQNDSKEEIREIAKFIASIDPSIPWHVSAFRPMYKMKDIERTKAKTLLKAYDIGKQEGLKYVYVGNIDDKDHHSTYCPKCKDRVIDRRGYLGQYLINKLDNDGVCPHCEQKIEGVWS